MFALFEMLVNIMHKIKFIFTDSDIVTSDNVWVTEEAAGGVDDVCSAV